jgi:nitrogen-specific signal transduction histidine kinase/CheY-like chemotaxis protein
MADQDKTPEQLHEELRALRDHQSQRERLHQQATMEALGRMAGGMAHHFNNLLTVIVGYGDILLSALPPADPLRPPAEAIRKAADRAAALTRQLLAIAGKQILRPEALDLNALVAGRADLLRSLAGEGVELVTDLDPALGPVMADPGQVEQALVNLVAGARQAMPGGGRLTIATSNVDLDKTFARERPGVRAGPYVLLAVSDTGPGIDEAARGRLFEPFFSPRGVGRGAGLGLATVYGIILQSGGHVEMPSEPGPGAVFRVYLPRPGEAVPQGPAKEGPAEPPRAPETVLLVEDEEMVRTLAATILRPHYTVLEASQGDEALRVAERHAGPIHLLLTDVRMPGLSGPELAERLLPLRPGLKVLFISGYPDDTLLAKRLTEPGPAFLQKPFPPDALERKVREVLSV